MLFLSFSAVEEVVERHPVCQNLRLDFEPLNDNNVGYVMSMTFNAKTLQEQDQVLVGKRNRFLAETPKPKLGPWEKPKFQPKPKFRPKQSISAETASFGRNVLFRPEQYMVLHQIFGQNRGLNMFFWPKETTPYFGHKRMFWQLILY